MQKYDFTDAQQSKEIQGNIADVDLATARPFNNAEAIDLAGRYIYVETEAFDDYSAVDKSSTKTTGSLMLRFNNKNGVPVYVEAGKAFEVPNGFVRVFVSNSAQAGKALRLVASTDAKIVPFKTDIEIVGDSSDTMTTSDSANAVTTGGVLVVAANASRKFLSIQNQSAQSMFIVGSATGSSGGMEIMPNGSWDAEKYTGAIYAYAASSTITASEIQVEERE